MYSASCDQNLSQYWINQIQNEDLKRIEDNIPYLNELNRQNAPCEALPRVLTNDNSGLAPANHHRHSTYELSRTQISVSYQQMTESNSDREARFYTLPHDKELSSQIQRSNQNHRPTPQNTFTIHYRGQTDAEQYGFQNHTRKTNCCAETGNYYIYCQLQ